MKDLLVYLKNYKKECILAPLFKMLEASFELFVPLVMASMIDIGIGEKNFSVLYRDFGILVMLGIIGLLSSVTAQFFAAKAAVSFATNVRHSLFQHLMNLSYTEIDTLGTSTMITRMTNDVNQAQTGVNMFLRLFLRSPFVVFGAMIMAFTIDAKEAMLFVFAIVGLGLIVCGIMAFNIPMLKSVQEKLDQILLSTRENLTGVRVIRAFCLEDEETRQFKSRNNLLAKKQVRAGNLSALMNPMTYMLINVAIAVLIYTGAIEVSAGVLTQGQVIALYNYMSQILVELIKLANLIVTINKSIASGNRIAEVFSLKCSMESPVLEQKKTVDTDSAIRFHNVSLQYKGAGEESLSDLDFDIKKGQTVGIIGGTGSGKSSLVHLITRFYDATKGTVEIDGVDVKEYTPTQLRKKIGIVMQKAVLFHGTIKSNLLWGNEDASDETLEQMARISQSMEVIEKKGGLDAVVEQNGRNFSGGQKQRLSIARTLVGEPEILILDDSSSALDFATDASLRKAIHALPNKPTTLIVSQRTSSIKHADTILVLDDGRLVGIGTHEELLNSCEVYREIFESQFKKEAENK